MHEQTEQIEVRQPADVDATARQARIAQERWARLGLRGRLAVIRRLRHRIADRGRELAESIDIADRDFAVSMSAEVIPLADACRFLERQAGRILRPQRWTWWSLPFWLMPTRLEIHREPFGIVLIIGPGNYPLLLPGIQAVQSLVAGNAVLVKPAPGCAEPMIRLRKWLIESGLDPSLLVILETDVASVEHAIEAGVDKVLLTGSAGTGRALLGRLAGPLVPSVMELSGCDAVFVCEDADLELTARCLVFGLILNGGRTCIAPRRVFVPAALKTDLEERLLELARESPFVDVRPETARMLAELIDEAQQSDARILCGELDPDGSRIRPIILTDAKPGMTLLRADVFAPILSLVGVADMEQALAWNGLCPYALGAAVFGGRHARELAGRIDAGVVVINDTIVPHADPRLPFAPRGASGFGVTRGAEGLLELTRPKAISRRTGHFRPHLEPRRSDDGRFFCEYLLAAHAGCAWSRIRAAGRFLRLLIKRSRSNGASS